MREPALFWGFLLVVAGFIPSQGDVLSDDTACTQQNGTCMTTSKTCIGGSYRKGFCAGPVNRRCCIPFPTNDDPCTQGKGGTCKHVRDGCEGGDFWVGYCQGALNRRCCIPNAGCDPNNMDFRNIPAAKGFEEEKIMGTWYHTQWYMPLNNNISDTIWDRADTFFKKDADSNTIFFKTNGRENAKRRCSDEVENSMKRIGDGVYHTDDSVALDARVRSTFVYVDERFMVEVLCYVPLDNGCKNFGAAFWSRCRTARPQDVAKGISVLKKLCYPELSRFINVIQEKNCAPPPPKLDYCDDDEIDDDECDENDDEEESYETRCRKEKANLAFLYPAVDVTEEHVLGVWYQTHWYMSWLNDISKELSDRTTIRHYMPEHPGLLFFDTNWRPKGTDYCSDGQRTNVTTLQVGQYEAVLSNVFTNAEVARINFLYSSDTFQVVFMCYGRTKDGCVDVEVFFFSRTRKINPKDVAIGVKLLRSMCYPDMRRYAVIPHTMDCLPPKRDSIKCGMDNDDDRKDKKQKGDDKADKSKDDDQEDKDTCKPL